MSAKTVFACTHIDKDATVDNWETGCRIDRTCVMSESVNYTADTLENLVKKVCDVYGLDFPTHVSHDEVYDANDSINVIQFDRLETASGDVPTEEEIARWKDGRLELYVADYTLHVEKRRVENVTINDVEGLPCDVA